MKLGASKAREVFEILGFGIAISNHFSRKVFANKCDEKCGSKLFILPISRVRDDFSFVKSEINSASDGSIETTKPGFPGSPAVYQKISCISRANSVPLCILLSRIPCK